MKKILLTLAVIAIAVSCQKSGKATFRVVFEASENTASEENATNLNPAWDEGEGLISFDDEGNSYNLAVTSVENGVAVLEGDGIPYDKKLHFIHLKGASSDNLDGNMSLNVDFSIQKGDNALAAMLSECSGHYASFIRTGRWSLYPLIYLSPLKARRGQPL